LPELRHLGWATLLSHYPVVRDGLQPLGRSKRQSTGAIGR